MENEKEYFHLRTTSEAARLLREMAGEAKHNIGDEFLLIMQAEWNRRHPQEQPAPRKHQTQPRG